MRNYVPRVVDQASVNTINFSENILRGNVREIDEDDLSDSDGQVIESLFSVDGVVSCNHAISSLPYINASVGSNVFCAILDSGAEVSLVSVAALKVLNKLVEIEVVSDGIASWWACLVNEL